METKPVSELRVGEKILPPERELRLWMRRTCAEKGLPETALLITITEVYEGTPDKRGSWHVVKGYHCDEWYNNGNRYVFSFKARPDTPWPVAA